MSETGTVYLVGAGPGDPGLLTLRGAELLQRADVVIYDRLVNPELLRLTRPGCELIARGKRAEMPQETIHALMIERARAGKCVVRLKGGDPYVFSRGAEEAGALAAAGVPFEVVSGVSSITAALNTAGIPLTHRALCSNFTVFTGHEGEGKTASDLDFDQIARTRGTKVVLMGLTHIGEIARALLARGVSPDTPVAVIEWGTLNRQKTVAGTLGDIERLAAGAGIRPPAITVIGEVVRLREQLNWFERRPLFGRRIVVTRARAQAGPFVQRLKELGAEVLEVPTIKIEPPSRVDVVSEALAGLGAYDWLVFTSPNGVTAFFEFFFRRFEDLREIGGVRLAAVGPVTAAALRALHLQVDLVPPSATALHVAEALKNFQTVENLRIGLLRAEEANPDLPRALEELGAIVDDIPVYRTVPETEDPSGHAAQLLESGADWVTFTSGSTVRQFHARFDLPALQRRFAQLRLASIGPETSDAIRALGLRPDLEASEHTTDGLVKALLGAA
ncbi:MAG: uroporphyrinogen-III C-methyltransferase [Verrucomicrobiae bacterium]|nr:uroporphyrinogen-III C-methyltransferase [Verrucomicrobiae bacterium]